jgi:DivIVA domain-containing protein
VSLLLLLVVLAVIAGIAVVATGRGSGLDDVEPERSPGGALRGGPLERADIDRLRFTLAFRGYRMDEVDDVLDRLVAELERKDARIRDLEAGPVTSDDEAREA